MGRNQVATLSSYLKRRLDEVAGATPRQTPNVRILAGYAQHARCNLATLGFVTRVNFDRLLHGTAYQPAVGQSPFAFSRGIMFENLLRKDNYAATVQLFRTLEGFPVADVRVRDLRTGYPADSTAMALRARDTEALLWQIIQGDPTAPHLIDGAVLTAVIGGKTAYFEADAVAAWVGSMIRAAEIKSFPKVDELVDPEKLTAALDQVAFYILLIRELVERLGGDPERLVSDDAILITPKNIGLTPTLSHKSVTRRITRNQKLLDSIPPTAEVIASIPAGLSFGPVADTNAPERYRLDVLNNLADHVGTCYEPSCLASCGNAKFCRERAFRAGLPSVAGSGAVHLLPEIKTLDRAEELTHGAAPTKAEVPVATLLERAGRLYDMAGTLAG